MEGMNSEVDEGGGWGFFRMMTFVNGGFRYSLDYALFYIDILYMSTKSLVRSM